MMREGVTLLFIGMGTVFLFLILLVYCTHLMSSLIGRYFPETAAPPPLGPPTGAAPDNRSQAEMAAAITAAVHHHRQRR